MSLSSEVEVYQLRVYLRKVSPIIWRRILVRSDSTIADLHYMLQAVVTSPYGLVTILLDEVTLSQKLRTPPFPVTHVLVGCRYCWRIVVTEKTAQNLHLQDQK